MKLEPLTHRIRPECDRFVEVTRRLDLYARARWVVTTRIHAFLPCVAMGTPVVFVPLPSTARRFPGYRHLAWSVVNAPLDNPRQRVDPAVISGMMVPLRDAVRRFAES